MSYHLFLIISLTVPYPQCFVGWMVHIKHLCIFSDLQTPFSFEPNDCCYFWACWFGFELFITESFGENEWGKNSSQTKATEKVGGHRYAPCKHQSSVL